MTGGTKQPDAAITEPVKPDTWNPTVGISRVSKTLEGTIRLLSNRSHVCLTNR